MAFYQILMVVIFILGYCLIALEHPIKINKSATAILLAVVLWAVFALMAPLGDIFQTTTPVATSDAFHEALISHLGDTSEIIFFLLGAMTIVETVDAHEGFTIITDRITTKSKRKLLWVIAFITFFMSSVLDNLTTAIVMCALLRKLISDKHDRWFFAGVVVIAANAGGAWSPIGDVTTIMLWIKGNITTLGVMKETGLTSIISLIVPVIGITFMLKGNIERPAEIETKNTKTSRKQSWLMLCMGVGFLLFTPIFKTITNLPPYLGILLGLGVIWVTTEILHSKNPEEYDRLSVLASLKRVDIPSVLFFLGILMAVSCLATAGHLKMLANGLDKMGNFYVTDIVIGIISSVVDNVPLVAAAMGMYPIDPSVTHLATDGAFWEFLAYCAGTGGSLLIIGSAAGVAVMGMEKIDFIWYMKKISPWALLGYFAGAGVYILQSMFLFHTN
jgi:Na+/H+ antiporter NhaD/arsenite permease-like protein